jgi:hypothetical protein
MPCNVGCAVRAYTVTGPNSAGTGDKNLLVYMQVDHGFIEL